MSEIENPPFLSRVAEDMIDRFGTDMSAVTVVFPSRRAGLFFNNYLFRHAGKPLWAPQYQTLDDVFAESSRLQKGDSIQLIGELYDSYISIYNKHASSPSTETLDEFFFFGEILLKDFDDIDKNLADARLLFSNLQDLDSLRDDFSHLSESQIETLKKRFNAHFQGDTALKSAFWSIWNILGEVYTDFKTKLEAKGLSYPGMMMRSVIEDEQALFSGKHYAFVGFNVLSKCEQRLFSTLKDRSFFYWDYDNFYLKTEAGSYIRENILRFGSTLPADYFESLAGNEKKITFVASPSESAQTAIITPWLESLDKEKSFKEPDSAIVLSNEALLLSVMHSVPPEKVENVNITMGFPIVQTPISGFLHVLGEMQVHGYVSSAKAYRYRYVLPVLRHPYTTLLFPEAAKVEKEITDNNIFFPDKEVLGEHLLFRYASTTEKLSGWLLEIVQQLGIAMAEDQSFSDAYRDLYNESVFRSFQTLNRLNGLLVGGEWRVEKVTFFRLLRKLLSTLKVPFHGEPIKGLQIMGVLETRALDFKNLLMLSVNEGFMPGNTNESTFIPEFLRKEFGLSTIEHQDSIYAYYFYRLIQRAENITLVYNTDKTQTGKAEMSRFLLQLLVDPALGKRIRRIGLQTPVQPWQPETISIKKDAALMEKIRNRFDANRNQEAYRLSPTALNTFISCPFRFYLQYIEEIKAPDEMSDELDNSVFGLIFHRAAEYLYRQIGHIPEDQKTFPPFVIRREDLEPYLAAPHRVEKLVTRAFVKEYFKGKEVDPKDFDGQQLIKYKVIVHLLKRLVRFDMNRAPFTLRGLEHRFSSTLSLADNTAVRIGGVIDRLEEKDGRCYILDYKSSGRVKDYKEITELFEQKDKRASHIFQTFVYASSLLKAGSSTEPVIPALLYLQEADKEDYSPVIPYQKEPIEDFRRLEEEFDALLRGKISELFDPEIPFSQTEITSTCEYCDFKEMCKSGS